MSIREIRRLKQESPVVKQEVDEEKAGIDHGNSSTGSPFPLKVNSEESSEFLHCKLIHLRKVQLFLKMSLSRMDSIIQEYEDLLELNEGGRNRQSQY
jgi:hypothetical protein